MKKFTILFILPMVFFASSCSQEQAVERSAQDLKLTGLKATITTEYDKAANKMAIAVQSAVRNNVEFGRLLKEEALLQFDGDYDVLLKNFESKEVVPSDPVITTRSGGAPVKVGDLLEMYFPDPAQGTKSDPDPSFHNPNLEVILQEYPFMQVAIPAHISSWDPSQSLPVAVVPEDYVDGQTVWVPGYDETGSPIYVNALVEPLIPYIVVSANERWQDPSGLAGPPAENAGRPEAPTGLVATTQNDGITLSWNYSDNTHHYHVYRKSPNSSSFTRLTSVWGQYNTVYTDTHNLVAGSYYYYYVVAAKSGSNYYVESAPSATVYALAPAAPAAPINFKATMHGTAVELNWANGLDTQSQTRIEYSVPSHNSSYYPLGTYSGTTSTTLDKYPARGVQVKYRAQRFKGNRYSDYERDYIYPPYRNTGALSPVYVKQIKLSLQAEGWLMGKPECYLKVMGLRNGQVYDIQTEMDFRFNKRAGTSQVFTNRKVMDWYYDAAGKGWYDAIYFSLLEYDRTIFNGLTVSFSLKGSIKLSEDLGLESGITVSKTFSDKGEYCGEASYYYFENPEKWVSFPNYEAQILLSVLP